MTGQRYRNNLSSPGVIDALCRMLDCLFGVSIWLSLDKANQIIPFCRMAIRACEPVLCVQSVNHTFLMKMWQAELPHSQLYSYSMAEAIVFIAKGNQSNHQWNVGGPYRFGLSLVSYLKPGVTIPTTNHIHFLWLLNQAGTISMSYQEPLHGYD